MIPSSTTGDGIVPIILGFIYGMQYNKNGQSDCFQAIELNLILIDEILLYVQTIYMPSNWANLGMTYKNAVDISASIQNYCMLEILINKLVGLFSYQGLT